MLNLNYISNRFYFEERRTLTTKIVKHAFKNVKFLYYTYDYMTFLSLKGLFLSEF